MRQDLARITAESKKAKQNKAEIFVENLNIDFIKKLMFTAAENGRFNVVITYADLNRKKKVNKSLSQYHVMNALAEKIKNNFDVTSYYESDELVIRWDK